MAEQSSEKRIEELTEENRQMHLALDEIQTAIEPFIERSGAVASRAPQRQLVHDVRNILNELGLLRALVPDEEEQG